MNAIVEVAQLTKQFAELKAVSDLSFSVPRGEIYGFLGQNGAGKSTTIRMMLSLVRPTSGTVRLFGHDVATDRRAALQGVGAIIEKPDLYQYLTALQNLSIMARLSGIRPGRKELMQQLGKVGIADRAESRVKTFSQGMKQRLGLACALIHNPQLIVLDEPTNGLDPQGIADVRNLILQLSRQEGKTVFVSSHLLSEIEVVADSMLIIDGGRKMAEGRVSELLNPANTLVSVETGDDEATRRLLGASQWAVQDGQGLVVKMHRADIPELNRYLVANGVDVQSLHQRHSLEDYFLSLTKANQHVAAYKH